MLTLNLFRHARSLTYYLTVLESAPDLWLCAHRKDENKPFRIYAVDASRVPDLGTMVRETSVVPLPCALRSALSKRVSGKLYCLALNISPEAKVEEGELVQCDVCDARETVLGEITETTLEGAGWYLGHDKYALCPDHNPENEEAD